MSSDPRRLTESLLLHHLVEQQVDRSPDAVAVELEGRTWTYRELDTRANRLAHHLLALGVGPDVCVGLFVDRSMEMVLGIFAILKAGAAYVPLEPDLPHDRLVGMLDDVRPAIILTQSALAGRLAPSGARVVALDEDGPLVDKQSAERPTVVLDAEHAAYLIFTSGSTGRPKGTLIPHRAIVAFMTWLRREFRLGPDDAWLQKIPFSFDPSVYEIHAPLISGGRLVITRPGGQRDPAYLAGLIHDARVTHLASVPSVVSALLDEERFDDTGFMRCVFCGGEPLTPALVQRFQKRTKSALVNLYGPTETTIASTWWPCPQGPSRVPIGRPIAGTTAFVLDDEMKIAPAGVPGELYIGGAGLARGYLSRPALTAERFVPHPFSDEAGARLYRTGDLARVAADGNLEILGRVDDQIKLRGFRVELGEVTAAARACSGVRDALVVAREDDGEKRLIAYLVSDGTVDIAAVQEALARTLPDYMIPSAFVQLDAWPLMPNGKVDRKALPAPSTDSTPRPYTGPRTPIEEVCAGLFAAILKVSRVGIHDDFFELGGHSLLAVELVGRVRKVLGRNVSVRSVFAAPTVAGFAEHVQRAAGQAMARVPPVSRAPEGSAETSFAQDAVLHWEATRPRSATWSMTNGLRFEGPLNAAALERAVSELRERHATLRTTFAKCDGGWRPVVAPAEPTSLPVVDVRGFDDPEGEARRVADRETHEPFDVEGGSLFRAMRVAIGPETNLLLFSVHQLSADAASVGQMTRDIVALYSAHAAGSPPPPPLAVAYADFASAERAWLSGDGARAAAAWRATLAAVEPIDLPMDRPRPTDRSPDCVEATFELGKGELDAVTALCARETVTPFMVFLAAIGIVLHQRTRQPHAVVGAPMELRGDREDLQGVVGRFLNPVICHFSLSGEMTVSQLLARARAAAFTAYEQAAIPASIALGTDSPLDSPLLRIMLNGPNLLAKRLDVSRAGVRILHAPPSPPSLVRNDLVVSAWEGEKVMVCSIRGAADVFHASTIQKMTDDLRTVLYAMPRDSSALVSTLVERP